MPLNYEIIKDEALLKEFIEWLPDTLPDEVYYVGLFARKKYCYEENRAAIKADKAQLKRFTATKDKLLGKIRQLECPVGSYTHRDNLPIPPESLALYITLNPRSYIKAARNGLIALAHAVTKDYTGYNPHQLVMSEIHKAVGTRHHVDFDFDVKWEDFDFHKRFNEDPPCNIDALRVLRTRGGFHLIAKPQAVEEAYRKTWYKKILAWNPDLSRGDNMIPAPGTSQGMHIPYFEAL